MTRGRIFPAIAVLAGVLLSLACGGNRQPQGPAGVKNATWRYQHGSTANDEFGVAWSAFASDLNKQSSGAITIQTYWSLGLQLPGNQQVSLTSRRVVELGEVTSAAIAEFPEMQVPALPGLVDGGNWGLRQKVTDRLIPGWDGTLTTRWNQRILMSYLGPPQTVISKKPTTTLAALKGQKIGVLNSANGDIARALGAIPVTLPAPDIYTSIQSGVIDGAFVNNSYYLVAKLNEVAKYVLNLNVAAFSYLVSINLDVWKELSANQQALLTKLASEYGVKITNAFQANAAKYVSDMKAAGMTVTDLTAADADQLKVLTAPLIENWRNTASVQGRQVLDTAQKVVKENT